MLTTASYIIKYGFIISSLANALTCDTAAIEQKRTESLHKAQQVLGECYDGLLRGDKGCDFFCSSVLLGILLKKWTRKKLNGIEIRNLSPKTV